MGTKAFISLKIKVVAENEKRKNYMGFLKNIANFEAFRQKKKLISNLFLLKSDQLINYVVMAFKYYLIVIKD